MSSIPRVILSRRRQPRIERGHPWVYRTEIASVQGRPSPGEDVAVVDAEGRVLGYGYYNPVSMITVRLLTRLDPPAPGLWRERIDRARARRERLLPGVRAYRAVHAEGDDLPGLIVDRFDDVLVVESLTLGIEARLEPIVAALVEVYGPRSVFLRGDAPVRRLEGLDDTSRLLAGEEPPDVVDIEEEGVAYGVDVRAGQKTGHFFDQRMNRRDAGALCDGAEVFDLFCHTGGFGLQALRQGAAHVVFVDQSAAALDRARANVERNGFSGRADFVEANAFDLLRVFAREGRRCDTVILDPPAFAKSRGALENALRGYNEINLRAMRLVPDGGHLVTASCSQPVSREAFLDVVARAAGDNHRSMRLLSVRGPAPDHPSLLAESQGDYLKCVFVEAGEPLFGPPTPHRTGRPLPTPANGRRIRSEIVRPERG